MTAYDLAMTDILRRIAELSTLVETIHKSVTGRLNRLEDAQPLAITQADKRARERERERDWKRTRDAAVQGFLANPEHADISGDTLVLDAKMIADEANGPLEIVVSGSLNIGAESLAKGGKFFELRQVRGDELDAFVNAVGAWLAWWDDDQTDESVPKDVVGRVRAGIARFKRQ